eukprot:365654-Chlamydomonas_euryale.AAC.5
MNPGALRHISSPPPRPAGATHCGRRRSPHVQCVAAVAAAPQPTKTMRRRRWHSRTVRFGSLSVNAAAAAAAAPTGRLQRCEAWHGPRHVAQTARRSHCTEHRDGDLARLPVGCKRAHDAMFGDGRAGAAGRRARDAQLAAAAAAAHRRRGHRQAAGQAAVVERRGGAAGHPRHARRAAAAAASQPAAAA